MITRTILIKILIALAVSGAAVAGVALYTETWNPGWNPFSRPPVTMEPSEVPEPAEEILIPPAEEEEELGEESEIEYEIFFQDIGYRGGASQDAYLPVKFLFIPDNTKISKIEGYLAAFNGDSLYSRKIGIAVGLSIPADCRAEYYIDRVDSLGSREERFAMEPELFKAGMNQITSWVSTYEKLAGENSWISLTLKFFYRGDAPRLLKDETVLTDPIDPISAAGCVTAETGSGGWKNYVYNKPEYQIGLRYPQGWSFTANLTEPSLNYAPKDIVNLLTVRETGPELENLQSVIFSIEVFDRVSGKLIDQWLAEGYKENFQSQKSLEVQEALQEAYGGAKGVISYRQTQQSNRNVCEVGRVSGDYFIYTRYVAGRKFIYGIGVRLPFAVNDALVSKGDSYYAAVFNEIASNFWFLEP